MRGKERARESRECLVGLRVGIEEGKKRSLSVI